ncbi:MAG: molybdopterin oxidoreductase [Eubacteriales bacterium]
MKEFHVLPNEPRAKELLDREILWCGLQSLLDEEEALGKLCPSCRSQVEMERCPCCGVPTEDMGMAINTSFDLARFEQMKKGERV